MNETKLAAYHTVDRAITIEDARHRIAQRADVPVESVYVGAVFARIYEEHDGTGRLVGYRTEWEFTAEVSL